MKRVEKIVTKVWVCDWESKGLEARTEDSRQAIIDEAIADGTPWPDGFEVEDNIILVDDWLVANLVELTSPPGASVPQDESNLVDSPTHLTEEAWRGGMLALERVIMDYVDEGFGPNYTMENLEAAEAFLRNEGARLNYAFLPRN